jgi:deoxyribodipyrimidine photo-lyase
VRSPAPDAPTTSVSWLRAEDSQRLESPDEDLLPLVGEKPATQAWRAWLRRDSKGVADYAKLHDLPGVDATSQLSIALRWGTCIRGLCRTTWIGSGQRVSGAQIAWRDFFADVLFQRPDAVRAPIRHEFSRCYPDPIVVHAIERDDALDRYAVVRGL